MRLIRLTVWVVCVSSLFTMACDDLADGPVCLADCGLCSKTQCPPDRCGLSVVMSSDCQGLLTSAEIAVGQCVEDNTVAPGTSSQVCGTVPIDTSEVVTIRSDDWVWQRWVDCDDATAGKVVILTLSCVESE